MLPNSKTTNAGAKWSVSVPAEPVTLLLLPDLKVAGVRAWLCLLGHHTHWGRAKVPLGSVEAATEHHSRGPLFESVTKRDIVVKDRWLFLHGCP